MIASWKERYDKPRQRIKSKDIISQISLHSLDYGLSSSHVWLWELYHKEDKVPKNCYFQSMVLEKTPESPLEIKPVNPKVNQPWILTGRTDAEAEAPTLWPPDVTRWLIGTKTLMLGKIKAEGEEGNRGYDGWMASWIQWTWTWANSKRWWRTGKPGLLQCVRQDLVTEQQFCCLTDVYRITRRRKMLWDIA